MRDNEVSETYILEKCHIFAG